MKNFPRVKQLTGSYCGPAVFGMLVGSLGYSLDQEAMVEACGARKTVMKTGIPLKELAAGLSRLYPTLQVWAKMDSTIEDIQELQTKGYLVGVDWQGIFSEDEYGDDEEDKWGSFWDRARGVPELRGTQGHYCVVLEVNTKKGYLKFADPYGHYAGRDRFVAIWEFFERWWDDTYEVIGGRKVRVEENRMLFLITKKGDKTPASLGLKRV